MPGIRLFDVRAALAALGLAGLAALALAFATHLPLPATSGPTAPATSAGLSRLQSLPLQAQSVISSTIAADSRAFAARRTGSGWGLAGGGVRADFRGGEPSLRLTGGSTLSLSLAGFGAADAVTASGNRVSLSRSGIREWYAAGPLGIEQGFTLAHRPGRNGVRARADALARRRRLAARTGRGLRRELRGIARRYRGAIWGADRGRCDRAPPAQRAERCRTGACSSRVNDRGARYPLTIDPLVQQAQSWCRQRRGAPGENGSSDSAKSVAISADGNTVLVGGSVDNAGDIGAAWVFTRSGSTWTQQGPKLVPT